MPGQAPEDSEMLARDAAWAPQRAELVTSCDTVSSPSVVPLVQTGETDVNVAKFLNR